MKRVVLILSYLQLAVIAAPANAAPVVDVGATIHDPAGEIVGTIKSVNDTTAVLWTGSQKITLGLSSFMMRSKGLTISMTREQLENAANNVQSRGDAEIKAKLSQGTSIIGADESVIATVDNIEAEMVILTVGTAKVKFPLSAFSADRSGVRMGMTAAQLAAAIEAQRPAKPAATETAPAAEGAKPR